MINWESWRDTCDILINDVYNNHHFLNCFLQILNAKNYLIEVNKALRKILLIKPEIFSIYYMEMNNMTQIFKFIYTFIIFLSLFFVEINGGMSSFTPFSNFQIYLIYNIKSTFKNILFFLIWQCSSETVSYC